MRTNVIVIVTVTVSVTALLGTLSVGCAAPAEQLAINEVMPRNGASITDSAGENDDWIEIVNIGEADVVLDGFSLGDATGSGPFPAGTVVPAGGFLVVFADDSLVEGTPEEPHFPFKLSGAGDSVALRDASGVDLDGFDIPDVAVDISFGRVPDGTGEPAQLSAATPRASNGG